MEQSSSQTSSEKDNEAIAVMDEINIVIRSTTDLGSLASKWATEKNEYQKIVYSAAINHISHHILEKKMDSRGLDYDMDALDKLRRGLADNIVQLMELNETTEK